MNIYRFDQEVGKPIDRFGSQHVYITPIMRVIERNIGIVQVACMHLLAGGIIGGHEAATAQLFIVVAGEGWVSGTNSSKIPIQAGQLAYWKSGEWHEASTEQGMTAIVIESDQLEPIELLQEISMEKNE